MDFFFLLLSIESLKETKGGQENAKHHDKIGGAIRSQHVATDEKNGDNISARKGR